MRRLLTLATLTALALAACSTATYESSGASAGAGAIAGGDRDAGARVFAANCETCHGRDGAGSFGPSLHGESQRMDYEVLVSWIDDPEPPMPALAPKFLTGSEVRDVAAYVESL